MEEGEVHSWRASIFRAIASPYFRKILDFWANGRKNIPIFFCIFKSQLPNSLDIYIYKHERKRKKYLNIFTVSPACNSNLKEKKVIVIIILTVKFIFVFMLSVSSAVLIYQSCFPDLKKKKKVGNPFIHMYPIVTVSLDLKKCIKIFNKKKMFV